MISHEIYPYWLFALRWFWPSSTLVKFVEINCRLIWPPVRRGMWDHCRNANSAFVFESLCLLFSKPLLLWLLFQQNACLVPYKSFGHLSIVYRECFSKDKLIFFPELETQFGAQLAHAFVLHSMFTWHNCQSLAATTVPVFVFHDCGFQHWSQHLWPHKRLSTAAAGLRCPWRNKILKHTSVDV